MHEGAYRVLAALASLQGKAEREQLVRVSGEAESVVKDSLERYAKWFEQIDRQVSLSLAGWAAWGRENAARRARPHASDTELAALFEGRPDAKRELDQFHASLESVAQRAKLLVENGEQQRGLAFLGDDDLTALAVHHYGTPRRVTTFDIDTSILEFTSQRTQEMAWEHSVVSYDAREPLPREFQHKYGCVFTDPPYALRGFKLFLSRAIEMLKPDGRLYICFGYSRRALERGLAKQSALTEAGLLIEEVKEGFNRYEGAGSIGSKSALWICSMTSQARPLIKERFDGPIYSTRPEQKHTKQPDL